MLTKTAGIPSTYFDIDEKALGLGVEYFVQYVLEWEKELKK